MSWSSALLIVQFLSASPDGLPSLVDPARPARAPEAALADPPVAATTNSAASSASPVLAADVLARAVRRLGGTDVTGGPGVGLHVWSGLAVASTVTRGDADGETSAATAELLSLVAEIAVRRAKRNGLAYLQELLTDRLCELEHDGKKLFPATCDVVKTTSLERLAGDPEVLATALTKDLFAVVQPTVAQGVPELVLNTVAGGVAIAARVAATRGGTFDAQDAREIAELLLRQAEQYSKTAGNVDGNRAVAFGLASGAVMVAGRNEGLTMSVVSVLATLEANTSTTLTTDQRTDALTLAGLVYRAAGGDGTAGPDAARVQVLAGLQAVFLVLEKGAPCGDARCRAYRDAISGVTLGAVERNVPRVLASATGFLANRLTASGKASLTDKQHAQLEKLTALLAGIAAYAETYDSAKTEGKTAEELRAARKEVLEGIIDAATVRTGRGKEWVASLGMSVGFTAVAGQWMRAADGSLGARSLVAPQLALPLGIAIQRLPGAASREDRKSRRFFANGFHLMVTAMDLGQFLAYDATGKVSRPTWSSFVSPGAQIAWALGRPNNMLLVGAEARYAPTLFSPEADKPGGAVRVGLFVAYYIPFLDFN